MPNSRAYWASAPLLSHATARPRQAGTSFVSQTSKVVGRRLENQAAGTSQRYDLTHCHPGQARTACTHTQLDDRHRAGLRSLAGCWRPPQLRRGVTLDRVGISHGGACAPSELEEVPMTIVGGLDIHRKQLTFDYLDTVTGEVKRAQIAPADRGHLRAWLARFAGRDDVAFAMEGCTGWRYVAEELAAAGCAAHAGEPAGTAAARGRKRHARTDKTDSRHLRQLLADGRLPEGWIPPAQILECRALPETYHDLRREHTAQAQLRGLLPPGRPAAGPGRPAHRPGPGRAAGRRRRAPVTGRAAADRHRPGHARRPRCPHGHAAPAAPGHRPPPHRRQGARRPAGWCRAGRRPGSDLLARRRRAGLLLAQGSPVRRAGRHRLLLRRQALTRAPVPPGPGDPALGGV